MSIGFLIGLIAGVSFQRQWGLRRVADLVGINQPPPLSPYQQSRVETLRALPLPDRAVVLVGDSLIHGHEWHEVFGSALVVTRAIPGATTLDLAGMFDYSGASGVIFLIGVNDAGHGVSTKDFSAHYQRMVDGVPEGTQVTLITLPPITRHGGAPVKSRRIASLNQEIKALAARKGYACLDPWRSQEASQTGLLSDDGLHLSPLGYRILVDSIEPIVTKAFSRR